MKSLAFYIVIFGAAFIPIGWFYIGPWALLVFVATIASYGLGYVIGYRQGNLTGHRNGYELGYRAK